MIVTIRGILTQKIPNEIITEDNSPAPLNIYGLTHFLSEDICSYYNVNTETKCINVRLSNSYGSPVFNENSCWWLVVNDLCKSAFLKNKILTNNNANFCKFLYPGPFLD